MVTLLDGLSELKNLLLKENIYSQMSLKIKPQSRKVDSYGAPVLHLIKLHFHWQSLAQ